MDIAIIGAGKVGKALTSSATRSGHRSASVLRTETPREQRLRSSEPRPRRPTAKPSRKRSSSSSPSPAQRWTTCSPRSDRPCRGRVLVDANNPLKPDSSGLATEPVSGAETIQGKAPGARVIKTFNTALAARQTPGWRAACAWTATRLEHPYRVHREYRSPSWLRRYNGSHPPEASQMMSAGDDAEARQTVLRLLEDIGFNPVDAGGLAMARYLEGMAGLNISMQTAHGWNWQASWKLVGPDRDAA